MKEVNIPFSLYDFFAILLPGGVGAFGLYLFANPSLTAQGHQAAFSNLVVNESINKFVLLVGLIIFSYLIGHLFNAFSELLIDGPANALLGWPIIIYLKNLGLLKYKGMKWFEIRGRNVLPYKRRYELNEQGTPKPIGELLKKCIEEKFGRVLRDYGYSFTCVRAQVAHAVPEIAGEAKIFIATSAMFQSLVLAALLVGIALLKAIFAGQITALSFWLSIVLVIVLAIMFFVSYRRYRRLWVETLYAAFIVSIKGGK